MLLGTGSRIIPFLMPFPSLSAEALKVLIRKLRALRNTNKLRQAYKVEAFTPTVTLLPGSHTQSGTESGFTLWGIPWGKALYHTGRQRRERWPERRSGTECLERWGEKWVRGDVKKGYSLQEKKFYVWWWMLTGLIVAIILQYIQISNPYAVYLKLI